MDDGRRVKYLQVATPYECLASLWSVYCVPPFLWGKRRADPHNCFQVFLLLSLSARSGLNLRFRKQEMIWCGSLVFLFTFEEFCKSDTHNFLLTQTNWLWLTGHTRNNHNRTYPPQWCAKFLTNNRRVCINFQTNRTMTRIIRLTVRGASSWPWKNLMSNWIKCGCADKSVCGG